MDEHVDDHASMMTMDVHGEEDMDMEPTLINNNDFWTHEPSNEDIWQVSD